MAASTSGDMTTLIYTVPRARAGWELHEGKVSESTLHVDVIDLLSQILQRWAKDRAARIVRNLAVHWLEDAPKIGIDPDLAVLEPPPNEDPLFSLRTWAPGHAPPRLAIEVVSKKNPRKDYEASPEKCAAARIQELVVFDPLLRGPKSRGGPVLLQVWRWDESGRFTRVYTGDGPAYSATLNAWFVATDDRRRLRVASDAGMTDFWLTDAEAERREAEAERREKEAALARIAALEAELARRGG